MKTESEKCGEIFRRGPGLFVFSCAYCSIYFDSKEEALDHIDDHFLLNPEPKCLQQTISEPTELQSNLFDTIEEAQIDENSRESSNALKIEIQDPFFNNFISGEYKYESVTDNEEVEFIENENIKYEDTNEYKNDETEKYWMLNRKKIVKCHKCGKTMQNASLLPHLRNVHGIFKK